VLDDQRRASLHASPLSRHVHHHHHSQPPSAAHYDAHAADSRPVSRMAAEPMPAQGAGGGGLPSLPAFQLQISLLMDQQRALLQRALKVCADRIDASVARLDERLSRVEGTCAKLDLRIADEMHATDAERAKLQQQLDLVAEERDRYLRRIVTGGSGPAPSQHGGGYAGHTATPSPLSPAKIAATSQPHAPPVMTSTGIARSAARMLDAKAAAQNSEASTPPSHRHNTQPPAPPPPPYSPPPVQSVTAPRHDGGPATASTVYTPSHDAIERLSRAIAPNRRS
jgi:hypothetical protein